MCRNEKQLKETTESIFLLILKRVEEDGGHGSYERNSPNSLTLLYGGNITHVVRLKRGQVLSPSSEFERKRLENAGTCVLIIHTYEDFLKWWTRRVLEIDNKLLESRIAKIEKSHTRKKK